MQSSSSERDPVELLADEFVQRRRRGETPSLTEYVERFPSLAQEIRAVFPAILALENVSPQAGDASIGLTARRAEITRSMADAIGDYRILREVGRGAMGVVYEAEQQSLDRRVALKVLPWHAVGNVKAVERFRREARAAARLHHTNIVPVYDNGQQGEICYFAMQFIQGQSLDNVMVELRHLRAGVWPDDSAQPADNRPAASSLAVSLYTQDFARARSHAEGAADSGHSPRAGGGILQAAVKADAADTVTLKHPSTIPGEFLSDSKLFTHANRTHYYRSVARIAERVADALAYAHEREIIHRDIKPSNLMLDAAGVVWVTDFGLAKTTDEGLTRSGDLLGTLRYMAPERFDGKCDARSDVYSLGLTLYELLCLRPARDASDGADLIAQITREEPRPPRKLDPGIPLDLERIVLKAIERDPKHRYPSAQAMAEDLRRFLNDQPILGRRVPATERFARWARRNRMLAAATVGGTSLLLTGLIVSTVASASFSALAKRERQARVETTSNLYHSLRRQAQAVRLARREGYRNDAWQLLEKAKRLDTPEVDVDDLRHEAVLSLGDFVGQQPVTIANLPGEITAATVSPDGKVAVVGLSSGVIRWYSADDGKLLQENKQHSAPVDQLKFDRSGDLLMSVDKHGAAKTWRKQDDHWQVRELATIGRPVMAIEPVHQGQLVVAYKPLAQYSEIEVKDLPQGLTTSIVPPAPITAVALSRSGTMLAGVGGADVYVWQTRGGALLERTTTKLGPLKSVAFSDDGQLLFCGSTQGLVVFDLPELRQQTFMRYDEVPLGAFSPEGMHIAFASENRRVMLWSVHANRELAVLLHPGWKDLHSLTFASNGRVLACADGDSVRIWRVRGGPERIALSGHAASLNAAAFSPDSKQLVSVGLDHRIKVWDAQTGQRVAINAISDAANAMDYSQDGRSVVVGDSAGKLYLMDASSLKLQHSLDSGVGEIRSIREIPQRDWIAVAGARGVSLWKVLRGNANKDADNEEAPSASLELVRTIPGEDCASLVATPGGDFLAWLENRQRIRLLETATGVEWPVHCPPLARGQQNLAFDPSGEHLLMVNQQGQLLAWNAIKDREEFTLGEPSAFQAAHLAASPRGPWLAAAELPMQISIWNLPERKPFFLFREEPSAVNVTAWSRNGRQLAVGCKDGSLAIWDLPALQKELAGIELDWPAAADAPAAAERGDAPLKKLQAAVEAEPDDRMLRLRLANILARNGQDKSAAEQLNLILRSQPDHRESLLARANLEAKDKSWKNAATDYLAALHLDQPSTLSEWRTAAILLALAGDANAYRQHCEAMFQRLPDNATMHEIEQTLFAGLLMKASLPADELPLRRLQEALRRGGDDVLNRSRATLALALAADRRGESSEAVELVRRAQDESDYTRDASLPALSFAILALAQENQSQKSLAATSLEAARDFARRLQPPTDPLRFANEGQTLLETERLIAEAARLLDP